MTILIIYAGALLAQQPERAIADQRLTCITGKVTNTAYGDTLLLVVQGPFFTYQNDPEWRAAQVLKTTADQNGEFKFQLSTGNSPFHVSLFLSSKRTPKGYLIDKAAVSDYLIEPGDSINVIFGEKNRYYTGKGAALFDAQFAIRQTDPEEKILKGSGNDSFKAGIKKWIGQKDSLLKAQLNLLRNYQAKLSPVCYGIISADIIGTNRAAVCAEMMPIITLLQSNNAKSVDPNLADVLKEIKQGFTDINPTDRSCLAPRYIYYLFLKLRFKLTYDHIFNGNNAPDYNYFPAIIEQYSGILRDKLLAFWLIMAASKNLLQPEFLVHALTVMKTPVFIQITQELQATYAKGQAVTDFNFKNAEGKTVRLSDFRGKILLVDLWFSGCGGCLAVAAGLPTVEKAFENRSGVAFISISIDKDKQLWLRSIDKNPSGKAYTHYTTPTTTYLYTGGTGEDNPFIKRYVAEHGYPTLLIIDKAGKVYSSIPVHPVNAELQKALIKELNEALASN